MNAAQIAAKINGGYGKAALRLGYVFQQYRPISANPLAGSLIGTINAAFSTGGAYKFPRYSDYKNNEWSGLFDPTNTLPGDYLINATHGTFFIADQQDLLPIFCISCNRTVSVLVPGPQAPAFGAGTTYGGTTQANEVAVMANWPASILFDARGRSAEVGLPTDLPGPYFKVLLPVLAGVDIRPGSFLSDDLGRRYTVAAAELSDLGWRISAQQAVT